MKFLLCRVGEEEEVVVEVEAEEEEEEEEKITPLGVMLSMQHAMSNSVRGTLSYKRRCPQHRHSLWDTMMLWPCPFR
jgi:hypothetical protein